MPVIAAVAVATVVKAVASKKAGQQAAKGAKDALDQSNATMNAASQGARDLFQTGADARHIAETNALNFYKDNSQAKINPMVEGNMAAQNVISQGAGQVNNAIMGLPVDMSFANTPQRINADYSGINAAQMPTKPLTLGAAAPAIVGPLNTAQVIAPELNKAVQTTLGSYGGQR